MTDRTGPRTPAVIQLDRVADRIVFTIKADAPEPMLLELSLMVAAIIRDRLSELLAETVTIN
jgi:hypothetical protein